MRSGAEVDENEEGRGNIPPIVEMKREHRIPPIVELKVEVADLTSSSPIAVKKQTQEMSDKKWQNYLNRKRLGSPERELIIWT